MALSKIIKFLKLQIHHRVTKVFVTKNTLKNIYGIKSTPNGEFHSFGSKNADKTFYIIWLDNLGSGFFSNISAVLCHIRIACESGMIPIVDFQNFKTLYNDKSVILGTKNSWEYYFKPVSHYKLSDVYQSKNVFFCSGKYPPSFSFSITEIPGLGKYGQKFIKPKKYINDMVNTYIKNLHIGKRTLGIHFRGQEQKYAVLHSFPPTPKQMFKYTDLMIKKYKYQTIFIVTEDQNYLNMFIARYGDMVTYTDSFRTKGENAYNLNPRPHHRYQLGLEVLVDSLLLSQCGGLLCGDSNVSEFARFSKNTFRYVYMIDNGINSSNELIARYLYDIKKLLPSVIGGLSNRLVIHKLH